MDAKLADLARAGGVLRYGLGLGLERLALSSGHHDLGFASLEAYALERCERSARWVQECRSLARRLQGLPETRAALQHGAIGFSMAQVLASVATPESETAWLDEAATRTVRAVRGLARRQQQANSDGQMSAVGNERGASTTDEHYASTTDEHRASTTDEHYASTETEHRTLTVTVDREDLWFFECARMVTGRVVGAGLDETLGALLGEGATALLPHVPRESLVPFEEAPEDIAQRAWEAQLQRWREEAEARCESNFAGHLNAGVANGAREFAFDGDATHLDAELRRVAGELSMRDLELGRLAEALWRADGWRRLGYATESQYARERLGMSLSAVKAKRVLARMARQIPRLGEAITSGELGYEAARLVGRVATAETAEAWVERARERTVRHLRQETNATEMLARLGTDVGVAPLDDEALAVLFAIETRVTTGAAFDDAGEPESEGGHLGEPVRASFERLGRAVRASAHGRVTLKLRLRAETARYYRWLERVFARYRPSSLARRSFLWFLCAALIESWKDVLRSDEAYAAVYARDHHRCSSPVCDRRDVTPHHLRFRSAGGDDTGENLATLCVWCHLEGIHGGRLRAKPPASSIEWRIGRTPHTVVRGRSRVSLAA